jgi:glucokinase
VTEASQPILCFETGGTKLVAALADGSGGITSRDVRYRRAGQRAPETLDVLRELGRRLLGKASPRAVSIGFGGTIYRGPRRPAACYHEAGWTEVDPVVELATFFGAPAYIENDCNLAALAEAHRGFDLREGVLLYVTVGTGIGAGVVHDGRLLALGPVGEAEVGHLVVDSAGLDCPCGNRGCLETLCSGPGLVRLAHRMGVEVRNAEALMDRFRGGEAEAGRVVGRAATLMGQAVGSAISLFAPSLVVFGGGVMEGNRAYLDRITEEARRHAFPPFRSPLRFELSRLRRDVVCQGAALWALLQAESTRQRG